MPWIAHEHAGYEWSFAATYVQLRKIGAGGSVGKPQCELRSGLHVLEEDMVNMLNESA